MKLISRADNLVVASIWADTLRAAGIRCELRNTTLSGALGEIPFLECAPQVWVNPHDEGRARTILAELRGPARGAPWYCRDCGEASEAQFGSCWKCGTARPD